MGDKESGKREAIGKKQGVALEEMGSDAPARSPTLKPVTSGPTCVCGTHKDTHTCIHTWARHGESAALLARRRHGSVGA
jgi:hypothetical protein